MTEYGITVTEAGYNVDTTDIRRILFSTRYPMFKYHSDSTTSLTITAGNTTGSVSVSHSLGYVPLFIAYVDAPGDTYMRIVPDGRVPLTPAIAAYSTTTAVVMKVEQIVEASNQTYNFRVIIFKDKLI